MRPFAYSAVKYDAFVEIEIASAVANALRSASTYAKAMVDKMTDRLRYSFTVVQENGIACGAFLWAVAKWRPEIIEPVGS